MLVEETSKGGKMANEVDQRQYTSIDDHFLESSGSDIKAIRQDTAELIDNLVRVIPLLFF